MQTLCTEANSPYHPASGTATAFTPSQFCVLFESICSAEIIATADLTATESTCETAYTGLAASAQSCRTDHLCNANASVGAEMPHCYHAQGWGSATVQTGGPCD